MYPRRFGLEGHGDAAFTSLFVCVRRHYDDHNNDKAGKRKKRESTVVSAHEEAERLPSSRVKGQKYRRFSFLLPRLKKKQEDAKDRFGASLLGHFDSGRVERARARPRAKLCHATDMYP